MKTLKNLSVIILFVGFIFLTIYITKSYYVFNDLQYQEIVNKLLAEEKKRAIDSELVKQEKLPTKMFEIMFKKPTPWMGYTDDLTKDFNEKDKETEKEISLIKDENKELKKKISEINNKISITKNMNIENKKEEEKLNKSMDLSEIKILKNINDLQKEQDILVDNINSLTSTLKELDTFVIKTEPIKKTLSDELYEEYEKKLNNRNILQKKIDTLKLNYQSIKDKVTDAKDLQKISGKTSSDQLNGIRVLEKNLLDQKIKLTDELAKLNKKIEKNNDKIKSLNSITSFEINQYKN